jgi:hypothetical protein
LPLIEEGAYSLKVLGVNYLGLYAQARILAHKPIKIPLQELRFIAPIDEAQVKRVFLIAERFATVAGGSQQSTGEKKTATRKRAAEEMG